MSPVYKVWGPILYSVGKTFMRTLQGQGIAIFPLGVRILTCTDSDIKGQFLSSEETHLSTTTKTLKHRNKLFSSVKRYSQSNEWMFVESV